MTAGLCQLQWSAPDNVGAVITTRSGGASQGPWESFNLAGHVGDDPAAVAHNRRALAAALQLNSQPAWLEQVHGVDVLCLDSGSASSTSVPIKADAAYTREPGCACVVMTADCLPVLLCDEAGSVVAASHGGWRGLAGGILRNTVEAMGAAPASLLAYLGPAISEAFFEVGADVREAFRRGALDSRHREALDKGFRSVGAGKFHGDLYALARAELRALGVTQIYGGQFCTYGDPARWYSYRRDGITGRMASLIWLKEERV